MRVLRGRTGQQQVGAFRLTTCKFQVATRPDEIDQVQASVPNEVVGVGINTQPAWLAIRSLDPFIFYFFYILFLFYF